MLTKNDLYCYVLKMSVEMIHQIIFQDLLHSTWEQSWGIRLPNLQQNQNSKNIKSL